MPKLKLKTHSGAKKRFRVSKNGKVKYAATDRGHLMTDKSKDRKRKLRKGGYLTGKQAENIKRLIHN
ncbi:MAG: 50S ribosomal protein L35 [Clostridia bacterium]|nr:50S ribosomal protein L35 [Clostridia bacterium]